MEPKQKHDVDGALIPVDSEQPLQKTCRRHDFQTRYEQYRFRNSAKCVL